MESIKQKGRFAIPNQEAVLTFLRSIGLEVFRVVQASGFIDNIQIEQGKLLVSPEASIADILHEAGHLAVLPGYVRAKAETDLSQVFQSMFDDLSIRDVDTQKYRAAIQSGECEATAWAFAAGRFLEIPSTMIIEDGNYNDEGAVIRLSLQCNSYFGINGLVFSGMCPSVKRYPQMARWLQV